MHPNRPALPPRRPAWAALAGASLALLLVLCGLAHAGDQASTKPAKPKKSAAMKLLESTGIYNFLYPKSAKELAAERLKEMKDAKHDKDMKIWLKQARRDGVWPEGSDQAGQPYDYVKGNKALFPTGVGQIIMILVGLGLIYLAIAKGFEPLLLLPIGFGGVLTNIPVADMSESGRFLGIIYELGVQNGLFPLLIFMGVGAMTDFGPLIANPKTALLGAAAQFGIFATVLGAIWLGTTGWIDFTVLDAAGIGIIGGADGPTSIYVARLLTPRFLGSIAVAAYSYMALVPIIQPPIMRALTTPEERKIEMKQLRHVGKTEKIVFPLIVLAICILLLPDATPLIGALMFGNLIKESGVVDRLANCAKNELINIVTIMLGLSVGSKLQADQFLNAETLGILALGLLAFCFGTAAGLILAKVMNAITTEKINPLIGSAGVSAVPMAARVSNKVGLEENPHNFLLMHAMGPNVAGVIGSAVAAGVLISQLKDLL